MNKNNKLNGNKTKDINGGSIIDSNILWPKIGPYMTVYHCVRCDVDICEKDSTSDEKLKDHMKTRHLNLMSSYDNSNIFVEVQKIKR